MRVSLVLTGFLIIAIIFSGCVQNTPTSQPPKSCPPPSFASTDEKNTLYRIDADPIPDRRVGECFLLHARTNLPVNETVRVYVYRLDLGPQSTKNIATFYGNHLYGAGWHEAFISQVDAADSGENEIVLDLDTGALMPTDYCLEISSLNRSTATTIPFTVISSS